MADQEIYYLSWNLKNHYHVYHSPLLIPILNHMNQDHALTSSLCSFFHPPVIFSLFGPNIFLSILFSNVLYLSSFHRVRDKVSHPYKATGKIIVFYFNLQVFR